MAQLIAGLGELLWGGGIEFEHFVMARDGAADAGIGGELGGFVSPEVSGDPAFGSAPVDGQEGEVDIPALEPVFHAGEADGVSAVVDRIGAELDDVSEVVVTSVFVFIELFVGGGDTVKAEGADDGILSGVETAGHFCHEV